MALAIWEWNRWIEMAKSGDGELFARGLLQAVRTHPTLRRKPSGALLVQYGFDSVDELAQELAIKILKDDVLMHARDVGLDDTQIGRRINQIITNRLIDIHRRWANERSLYENTAQTFQHDAEGRHQDFETFLEHRLADLGQSPEGQLIIKELLGRFYHRLTPRQRLIFNTHEEFLGRMKTTEMKGKLGMKKTTIYEEILRIRKELSRPLGSEFKT